MSKRDLRLYCADILDSGSAIIEFVNGLSFEQFCNDRKTYSAVIREFEIIGEAVGKLPEALKGRRPDVEWQDIFSEAIRRYLDSHRPDLMEKFIRDDVEWGLSR